MAWRESSPMDERIRFVFERESGLETILDLCSKHGISRKTGYKWLGRFSKGGI